VVKFELAIDEMKRRIDNKDSDEVIAEIARAELGLGLPGEETIATK
jgi:cell division protein FtsB